jgi:hypothetical protein
MAYPDWSKPTLDSAYADFVTEVKERDILPYNYIGGLRLSNDADADHDVNITAGEARDPTNLVDMRLTSEITKQIDAAWAVGDDAGGIDAGAVAVDTLYAVWLIMRSDTGVVDALFSTSFTAPTMPTNYDYKRLIGAVKTEAGAADIIAFTQSGDYFRYTGDAILDVFDNTITSLVYEVGTLSVPPNCIAHIYGSLDHPASANPLDARLYIRTNGAADDAGQYAESVVHAMMAGNFDYLGALCQVLVDGSSQVQYAAPDIGATGAADVAITTIGFWMLTRREP